MIHKRGVSGEMLLVVGAIVFSAIVVLVLVEKTYGTFQILDTDDPDEAQLKKDLTDFNSFIKNLREFMLDTERTTESTELSLGEDATILFFSKDSSSINGGGTGKEGNLVSFYIKKPSECVEGRPCVCLCSSFRSLGRSGEKKNEVFHLTCGSVASCEAFVVSEFVNKEKIKISGNLGPSYGDDDPFSMGDPFPHNIYEDVTFREGLLIKRGPLVIFDDPNVGSDEVNLVQENIFSKVDVNLGLLFIQKEDSKLGICGKFPCI